LFINLKKPKKEEVLMFEEKEKFKSRLDKNFRKVKAVRKKKNFRE
jgi:hypothetical protein